MVELSANGFFYFLFSSKTYALIDVSDSITFHVAKDTLVSISKSEVKPNKAKIYVVSGTVVSNLDGEINYETLDISATQASPKSRKKCNVLKTKKKEVLTHKPLSQKKAIQPQSKIIFTEGNSDAHLSFSKSYSNVSILVQNILKFACIQEKQSLEITFINFIYNKEINCYYNQQYASNHSTSLLGRAPPYSI